MTVHGAFIVSHQDVGTSLLLLRPGGSCHQGMSVEDSQLQPEDVHHRGGDLSTESLLYV